MTDLKIAGMVPWSSVDWPGHLVATVFLQGCPLNCTYCHNPDLIDPRAEGQVPWHEVLTHMLIRRGLLDGIVFSGGEPLRQRAVVDAAEEIIRAGNSGLFKVGVHTTGLYPGTLERMISKKAVHWVGLDAKTTDAGVGAWVRSTKPQESLCALVRNGVDHEVRITVTPDTVGEWHMICDEVRTITDAPVFIQPARGYDWAKYPEIPEGYQDVTLRV